MLGTHFYHEIIRKTIVGFGTLFNNIEIRRTDNSGNVIQTQKIPLSYGPREKFLARIEAEPQLDGRSETQITLPRIAFEMQGITYDSSRKLSPIQICTSPKTDTTDAVYKQYSPVPYNLDFELNIISKNNNDSVQILEQILPYFQPQYNLTVELVESIKEKRDIPIILENITIEDDYEGDFTKRRVLLYTLRFTAKTYLFGPATSASKDIIKKATVNYLTGPNSADTTRNVTYSVTPRATKNYTGDVVTNISADITATTKTFDIDDASSINKDTYINIEGEQLYIKSKVGNKITVLRGQDNTSATAHVKGAPIHKIDAADNALVEEGDDFGFDGFTTGLI